MEGQPILILKCPLHTSLDKLLTIPITKCFLGIHNRNWYHEVVLKDAVPPDTLFRSNTINFLYNHRTEATHIREILPDPIVSKYYDVQCTTSVEYLDQFLNTFIVYVSTLTMNKIYNKLLVKSTKTFCENAMIISSSRQVVFLYQFLNLPLAKNKNLTTAKKLLLKQFQSIYDLVRVMYFGGKTNTKTEKSSVVSNDCENCKLKPFKERFVNVDYLKFHKIFCNQSVDKLANMQNLEYLITDDEVLSVFRAALDSLSSLN